MINVEQISATQWGTSPTYSDENGNKYTQDYCFKNWRMFQVTNMSQATFERMAKKYNAKQASRKQARANFGGKWDSGDIAKEILTDKLMGRQR